MTSKRADTIPMVLCLAIGMAVAFLVGGVNCTRWVPDGGYDFCRDGRMAMTVKERRVLCEPKQLGLDGGTP